MIIVIASTGNNMEDYVDSRFGRCSVFVFFDTETKSIRFLPNPYRNAESRAGISAAQLIKAEGATKVIAGEYGVKVKSFLDKYKIQMITFFEEKTIQKVINLLNN